MASEILQVTVVQHQASQLVETVLHYIETTTGVGDLSAACALAFDTAVMSVWKPLMSNQWSYERTQAQKIWPVPILLPALNVTNAGVGGVAVAALSLPGCATLTKRSLYAGPKYRGRVFLSGLPTTYITDSQVNASGVTNLNVLCGVLDSPITTGAWTFDPIIYHKSTHTYDFVQELIVRGPIRAQRRREVGRGA